MYFKFLFRNIWVLINNFFNNYKTICVASNFPTVAWRAMALAIQGNPSKGSERFGAYVWPPRKSADRRHRQGVMPIFFHYQDRSIYAKLIVCYCMGHLCIACVCCWPGRAILLWIIYRTPGECHQFFLQIVLRMQGSQPIVKYADNVMSSIKQNSRLDQSGVFRLKNWKIDFQSLF